MKYGLRDSTIEMINSVFEKHSQIDEVILYGSRAKGNFKIGSDIDLSIKTAKDTSMHFLRLIKNELEELPMLYSFDVSLYHHISNPALKEHIDRVGKVFFKNSHNNIY